MTKADQIPSELTFAPLLPGDLMTLVRRANGAP